MHTESQEGRLSLYHTVVTAVGERVRVKLLTKATLVHLSHTLEDIVLTRRLPALIFTGFQESSYWRKATERYEALADVARQVCIFAGRSLPDDAPAHALQVTLREDDPARQEWFLAILSGQFSVILAGLDNGEPAQSEAYRRFETIWSFDPVVVDVALDSVEALLDDYSPERAAQLREARLAYPLRHPDPVVLSEFVAELLDFEEKLNQELRKANYNLVESETLLQMVVISAPVLLVATDRAGLVSFFDWHGVPHLERIAEPVLGQPIQQLVDDLPEIDYAFTMAIAGQRARQFVQTSDGFAIEIQSAPVYNRDSVIMGTVLVLIDVTERFAAEAALQREAATRHLLQQERELSGIKDRAMRIISHELNNPLNAISAIMTLLSTHAAHLTDDERDAYYHKVQTQIALLNDTVQDVALLVRTTQNALTLDIRPLNLYTLLHDLIQDHEMLWGGSHQCHVDFQAKTRTLNADARILRRAIANVLSNAVKYSPNADHIEVRVTEDAQMLCIAVQDYGIGIPAAERSSVLEPFVRGSNSQAAVGMGLGLAIVRDSVQLHGGDLSIQSALDNGTTVKLCLPKNLSVSTHPQQA